MAKVAPIHYQKLLKTFQLDGWQHIGTTGDHLQLKKKGFPRRLVIPKYKEIPVFIILNNLRTARISRERYFELLKQV